MGTEQGREGKSSLPYSASIRGLPPSAKLTLMCLESVAVGATEAAGLDDVYDLVGVPLRSFRLQIAHLVDAGIISIARSGDDVEIRFDGHAVCLARLRADVRDDPWAIMKAKVFATKGSHCHYCGRDASQVDHVIPRSRGGTDDLSNLVPACAPCNLSKGPKTPEEWLS